MPLPQRLDLIGGDDAIGEAEQDDGDAVVVRRLDRHVLGAGHVARAPSPSGGIAGALPEQR